MPPNRNLDRPFVELAYGPGSRTTSLLVEAVFCALLAWFHHPAGWLALAVAAACGVLAAMLDRAAALADWDRFSRVTMRELLQLGREKCFPRESMARRLLPLIGVLCAAVLIYMRSPRGPLWAVLSVPLLYVFWLFGRDVALTLAPPRRVGQP